jgi:hypothetical protein
MDRCDEFVTLIWISHASGAYQGSDGFTHLKEDVVGIILEDGLDKLIGEILPTQEERIIPHYCCCYIWEICIFLLIEELEYIMIGLC